MGVVGVMKLNLPKGQSTRRKLKLASYRSSRAVCTGRVACSRDIRENGPFSQSAHMPVCALPHFVIMSEFLTSKRRVLEDSGR